ncbi:MAG: universal stress protein [Deltaproteobacteria bacterium]|jgi:nucleotide-binding universal stress UspA family protein|nr:universal stress protein [Deltaproteobacteria bacterium]
MAIKCGTILFATDLTDNAAHALEYALDMATRYQAKLHVLHVMPEMDARVVNYVASVIGEDQFADYELAHEADIQGQLKERVKQFTQGEVDSLRINSGEHVSIEVCHGQPVEEILRRAESLDADLVVLGSHGKGRMHYVFLGSVAEKVLHRLNRPALVVPLPRG